MGRRRKVVLSVALPKPLARAIREQAAAESRPVSWVIEDALRRYLESERTIAVPSTAIVPTSPPERQEGGGSADRVYPHK